MRYSLGLGLSDRPSNNPVAISELRERFEIEEIIQDFPAYKTFVRTMGAQLDRPGQRQGAENDKARLIQASLRRYSRPRPEVDAKLNNSCCPNLLRH